jgi:hypothetical protein
MTFSADRAWLAAGGVVAEATRDGSTLSIMKLNSPTGSIYGMIPVPLPTPDELLGGLGVGAPPRTVRIRLTGATDPTSYRSHWAPLASAGGRDIWAARGKTVLREKFDAAGGRAGVTRIVESADPRAVVVAPNDGLFVALDHSGFDNGIPIEYFSPTDLATPDPVSVSGFETSSLVVMVANPAGGVVFANEQGHLSQWNPPWPP